MESASAKVLSRPLNRRACAGGAAVPGGQAGSGLVYCRCSAGLLLQSLLMMGVAPLGDPLEWGAVLGSPRATGRVVGCCSRRSGRSWELLPLAGTPASRVGAGAVPRRQLPLPVSLVLCSPQHLLPAADGGMATLSWSHAGPSPGHPAIALAIAPALCSSPSPRPAPEPPRDGRTCQGEEHEQHRGGVAVSACPGGCRHRGAVLGGSPEPRRHRASPSSAVGL